MRVVIRLKAPDESCPVDAILLHTPPQLYLASRIARPSVLIPQPKSHSSCISTLTHAAAHTIKTRKTGMKRQHSILSGFVLFRYWSCQTPESTFGCPADAILTLPSMATSHENLTVNWSRRSTSHGTIPTSPSATASLGHLRLRNRTPRQQSTVGTFSHVQKMHMTRSTTRLQRTADNNVIG